MEHFVKKKIRIIRTCNFMLIILGKSLNFHLPWMLTAIFKAIVLRNLQRSLKEEGLEVTFRICQNHRAGRDLQDDLSHPLSSCDGTSAIQKLRDLFRIILCRMAAGTQIP